MNILGVELGQHSAKAVLVNKGFASVKLVRAFEIPTAGTTPEQQLQQLLSQVGAKLDSVVLSLPREKVTTRLLTLPFKDRKSIASTYQNAAEPHLPFRLTDCRSDHYIASIGQDDSRVLVFAIKNEELEPYRTLVDTLAVTDRFLMVDSLAAVNAFLETQAGPPTEDVALLDFGKSRSSVELLRKGKLVYSRSFNIGGEPLTLAIMESLSLDRDRAEKLKCHLDDPQEDIDPDLATRAHAAMRPLLNKMAQELRVSLMTARNEWPDLDVKKIWLLGGGAALSDLTRFLGESLKIVVEPYRPEALARVPGVDGRRPPLTAYGLALYALNRGEISIDFLDRPRNLFRVYRKNILSLGAVAVVILSGIFLGVQSELSSLTVERDDLEKQVSEALARSQQVLKKQIPLEKLDEILAETRKKMEVLSSNRATPLTILEGLSTHIPREVTWTINDFEVTPSSVVVNSRTDSFASAQKIEATIKEKFSSIEFGEYQTDPRDRSVMFRMTIPLEGWEGGE